jgi:repressor LexA
MAELPPTRKRLLDFIQAEVHAGRPIPTLREIAAKLGFRGHRAAAFHLDALKRDGFIESESGKARSLRITSPLAKLRSRIVDIPLFGSIPAGFSEDREQEPDGFTVDVASIGSSRRETPSRFAWSRFHDRKIHLRR